MMSPFSGLPSGRPERRPMKSVGLIMGSDSDLPVIRKAADVLRQLEIPFEVHVYSAHRTPDEAMAYAESAKSRGIGVLVCAAGMAAHLAGSIAARTTLPVIGIPCSGGLLGGLDALLSTVQMPSGIPVAAVAVDGGANAALQAAQMLALSDGALGERLEKLRAMAKEKVLSRDADIASRL